MSLIQDQTSRPSAGLTRVLLNQSLDRKRLRQLISSAAYFQHLPAKIKAAHPPVQVDVCATFEEVPPKFSRDDVAHKTGMDGTDGGMDRWMEGKVIKPTGSLTKHQSTTE